MDILEERPALISGLRWNAIEEIDRPGLDRVLSAHHQ
jgi:hypothetical protein